MVTVGVLVCGAVLVDVAVAVGVLVGVLVAVAVFVGEGVLVSDGAAVEVCVVAGTAVDTSAAATVGDAVTAGVGAQEMRKSRANQKTCVFMFICRPNPTNPSKKNNTLDWVCPADCQNRK